MLSTSSTLGLEQLQTSWISKLVSLILLTFNIFLYWYTLSLEGQVQDKGPQVFCPPPPTHGGETGDNIIDKISSAELHWQSTTLRTCTAPLLIYAALTGACCQRLTGCLLAVWIYWPKSRGTGWLGYADWTRLNWCRFDAAVSVKWQSL